MPKNSGENNEKKYPLHKACQDGDLSRVKSLLKRRQQDINEFDSKHWTPLHCAASARQLDICKYLLSRGANPSLTTSNNATALHYIARMKEHALLPTILKALVDKGADVNHPNTYTTTPLHEAALRGSVTCMQFLLTNNAKIDAQNNYGETPLHMATRGGNLEAVELLLRKGARHDLICKEGGVLQIAELVFDRENFIKLQNLFTKLSFGDGAAQRTARNYETLPPEVVELVNQAKLRPQQIDQNFDIFVDIVRFATANKYLVPPPSSFSFSFQDKSEYSHLTLGAPLLIDTQDPRQIYKIESSPSGKGGFGTVYVARNVNTKKSVAVKIIECKNEKQRNKIEREVYLLKKCQHKNVVTLLEAFLLHEQNEVWLVMENMEGGALSSAIQRMRMTEKQIAYVVKQILEGLYKLHANHIIHRDIKSSNVMLSVHGDVKLVDFGLAFDLCKGGKIKMVGSPFWMAPEVIRGDPQSYPVDVWSLGITILEMANGKPPNHESKLKALFATATGETMNFNDPSAWSRDFSHFLDKCLKTNPLERPSVEMLLQHSWLETTSTRDEIIEVLNSIFLKGDLAHLGLI